MIVYRHSRSLAEQGYHVKAFGLAPVLKHPSHSWGHIFFNKAIYSSSMWMIYVALLMIQFIQFYIIPIFYYIYQIRHYSTILFFDNSDKLLISGCCGLKKWNIFVHVSCHIELLVNRLKNSQYLILIEHFPALVTLYPTWIARR